MADRAETAATLRVFEIELLRLLGYAIDVTYDANTREAVEAAGCYEYRIDQGPVRVGRQQGPMVFRGSLLLGIAAGRFDDPEVLQAASRLLREVIRNHLDGKELKTRKVLLDLHRARIPQDQEDGR